MIQHLITSMSISAHAEHQTYVELYHHGLYHIKSSALLCAVGLGIPGAIHRRGGAATISDLVAGTGVHPAKRSHLRRLMRMLTCFGIFDTASEQRAADDDDEEDGESEIVYTLTPVSSVLVVGDKDASGGAATSPSLDMSALLRLLARPSTSVSTFFGLEEWFRLQRRRSHDAVRDGTWCASMDLDQERRRLQQSHERSVCRGHHHVYGHHAERHQQQYLQRAHLAG